MSKKPKIVCLCGSTRFRTQYELAFLYEEHAGNICLTVPCFKDDPCCKTKEEQDKLDALHKHKIILADEILVINVNGYIGESTKSEIEYAKNLGKNVRYLFNE